jgi:asparagine synthetase B (glutamine-hydrolysing)
LLNGSVACLLDGEIHNLEHVASLGGVRPTVAPEAALAAAYARLGERALTHLRGEFALLIWDPRSRVGLLARDQLGSGSIFMHIAGGMLFFASELPELLAALPRTPVPHDPALVRWLGDGTTPPDRTLYEGVTPLPPASLIRLRDERWEVTRYWAPSYVEPHPLDREQAAARLRDSVIDAVARRVQGRRTAGVLLSGGLDSATVLASADQAVDRAATLLRAYSAVFPRHDVMDESRLICQQVEHHRVAGLRREVIGGSPLRAALRYLDRWRVPLPVPGHFIWEPLLAAAGRDGAECLLDGELGDELFGAPALLISDRLRRGRLGGAVQLARRLPGVGASPSRRLLLRLLVDQGFAPCLPRPVARLARRRATAPWWLAPGQARACSQDIDPQPWRGLDGPTWWAQLADTVTRGPDRLGFFDYFRRRGRAAGVPAQHPFCDLELIETVLRLPPEHEFDPSFSRPLLRQAMHRLVLDQVRLRRDKSYFDPLLVDCLAVDDREQLRRLLSAPDAEVRRFADPAGLRALAHGGPAAHPRGARSWLRDVWRLATAECWLRSQSDRGFARRLLDQRQGQAVGRPTGHPAGGRAPARSYVSPS